MITRASCRCHWVTMESWLSRSLLIRSLIVRALWIGHLRIWHLGVGPRAKARLPVATSGRVRSPWALAVVGRGHTETWLRGPVNVVMKRVALTHDGESTFVLGHGVGNYSLLSQSLTFLFRSNC